MIHLEILKQVANSKWIFYFISFLLVKITNEYAPLILFKASISLLMSFFRERATSCKINLYQKLFEK